MTQQDEAIGRLTKWGRIHCVPAIKDAHMWAAEEYLKLLGGNVRAMVAANNPVFFDPDNVGWIAYVQRASNLTHATIAALEVDGN
jgi:hypothetical protein